MNYYVLNFYIFIVTQAGEIVSVRKAIIITPNVPFSFHTSFVSRMDIKLEFLSIECWIVIAIIAFFSLSAEATAFKNVSKCNGISLAGHLKFTFCSWIYQLPIRLTNKSFKNKRIFFANPGSKNYSRWSAVVLADFTPILINLSEILPLFFRKLMTLYTRSIAWRSSCCYNYDVHMNTYNIIFAYFLDCYIAKNQDFFI